MPQPLLYPPPSWYPPRPGAVLRSQCGWGEKQPGVCRVLGERRGRRPGEQRWGEQSPHGTSRCLSSARSRAWPGATSPSRRRGSPRLSPRCPLAVPSLSSHCPTAWPARRAGLTTRHPAGTGIPPGGPRQPCQSAGPCGTVKLWIPDLPVPQATAATFAQVPRDVRSGAVSRSQRPAFPCLCSPPHHSCWGVPVPVAVQMRNI